MGKQIKEIRIEDGGQAFSESKRGFLGFQNKIKVRGEARFLVTAEFPYYRLRPADWSERLDMVKAVGINILTFYIPWNIHEPLAGKFDFDGRVRPQNNLTLFLSLLRKREMYAIVKPGPFICAEVRHGGIPDWVTSLYSHIVMRSSGGDIVRFRQDGLPLPAYLNPDYVSQVKSWYDVLSKTVIIPNQYPNGPIIAVQIENEIPYSTVELASPFSWGYSPSTVSIYRKWLKEKYHHISQYNLKHIPQIADFKDIEPPTRYPGWSLPGIKAWLTYQDWAEFKSFYAAKVLRTYSSILRDSGLTLPFYHDIVILDDESPVNYHEMRKVMYIGPNYWLSSSPMDDEQSYFYGLERILIANSVNNGYSYVPEMNWGWETGQKYDFLARCLLHELSGFNVYPIVDGANAGTLNGARYSNNPEPYPGSASIDVNGVPSDAYYYLKRLMIFLKAIDLRLSQSEKSAEIAVGYYPPYNYPRAYTFWAKEPISAFKEVFKEEIDQNKSLFYLIKTFSNHNLNFTVVNLSHAMLEDLQQYRILFIQSYKYMDRVTLIKLLGYVKEGGILVMGPEFPSLDIDMSPLKDLPISTRYTKIIKEKEINRPISIKWNDGELKIEGHLNYFTHSKNSRVLAQDRDGPYIVQLAYGRGQIILVGFNYYLTLQDNYKFFKALFEKFNIVPYYCWISEEGSKINVFRRISKNETFLFLTNRSEDNRVVEIDYLDELGTTRKLCISVRSKGNSIIETKRGDIVSAALQGSGSCLLRTKSSSIMAEDMDEFIFAKTDRGKCLIVGDRDGKVTVQSSTLQPNILVRRGDGKSVGRYLSDTEFEFKYSPHQELNPYVLIGW